MRLVQDALVHARDHPESAEVIWQLVDMVESLQRTVARTFRYGTIDWYAELADDLGLNAEPPASAGERRAAELLGDNSDGRLPEAELPGAGWPVPPPASGLQALPHGDLGLP